jgi:hypothetical protein
MVLGWQQRLAVRCDATKESELALVQRAVHARVEQRVTDWSDRVGTWVDRIAGFLAAVTGALEPSWSPIQRPADFYRNFYRTG